MKTIFVSSTFQDMQNERDIIRSSVLPRIREFARRYGESVDFCDLRWGINTTGLGEQESAEKIVQICFDEIDQARPFFIGLLGDRYGWAPDPQLIRNVMASQGGLLPELSGKSITEMEILYGMLAGEESENRCLFYFRTIEQKKRFLERSTLPEAYRAKDPGDLKKIGALKQKIQSRLPQSVHPYTLRWDNANERLEGLEAFADQVYEDLKALLSAQLGDAGPLPHGELERRQQAYAVETDTFFRALSESGLDLPGVQAEALSGADWAGAYQNLFLSSDDPYILNVLSASLCAAYEPFFDHVIPFDCRQSPAAGTMDGLVSYLLSACRSILNTGAPGDAEEGLPLGEKRRALLACFRALEERGENTLIAVRNLDQLRENDPLCWLPSERFRALRFMISSDTMPTVAETLREMTYTVFLPPDRAIDRGQWVDVYLKKHHKQLDDASKAELLNVSEGKPLQYLEFLLRRLLVLDQQDFSKINEIGSGIDAISTYFRGLLRSQPRWLEDLVVGMTAHLETLIDAEFSRTLTGMLLAAPYGLSESFVRDVDSEAPFGYSQLDFRTYCRFWSSMLNETLDGFLRFQDSAAAEILRDRFRVETAQGAKRLEGTMRWLLGRETDHEALLRDQYLPIAFRAEAHQALDRYVSAFRSQPAQIAIVLRELLRQPGAPAWLAREADALREGALSVLARAVYSVISSFEWGGTELLGFWNSCRASAERRLRPEDSHETLEVLFRLSYQCGEMAHRQNDPSAEGHLLRAKELSALDFRLYHNRVWRTMNGMPLTEAEQAQDRAFLGDGADSVHLGYGTEVQDMLTEQTWSDLVRVINSYLASIYRTTGERGKAQALQQETERMTRMLDPNLQNAPTAQIAPGVTILTPEALSGESGGKKAYRPDYRRNTAIQLAKEANALYRDSEYRSALEKYEQSNEILLEIYRDGEDRRYYDLSGVDASDDAVVEHVRTECLRDLNLNYRRMAGAAFSLGQIDRMLALAEEMLRCAGAFDEARNSRESKADLEESCSVAATLFISLPDGPDYERCFASCRDYFRYREEAAAKGEPWDQHVQNFWQQVTAIFYRCVTDRPQYGARAADVLLETSNLSAVHHDFEGYCRLTRLMSDLLDFTAEQDLTWGTLERTYIHNVCNLCDLWERNALWDRLAADGSRLQSQLRRFRERDSILQAANSVSRYGLYHFRQGEYEQAAEIFGAVMEALRADGRLICPSVVWVQHQSRYVTALSESGALAEADREAGLLEREIVDSLARGYGAPEREAGIDPSDFESALQKELGILYVNHAIILSRMGSDGMAQASLAAAEDWLRRNPELAAADPELAQRVRFFRESGLPRRKEERDGEREYRAKIAAIQQRMERYTQDPGSALPGLGGLEKLLSELEAIPEHAIFRSCEEMAELYYQLFQLYYSNGETQSARRAMRRAAEYAQLDPEPVSMYGFLFSDQAAVCEDEAEQLQSIERAIRIFEELRKRGQSYSEYGLAAALRNRGLLRLRAARFSEAERDVEHAIALLKECLRENDQPELRNVLTDAERLLRAIRSNLP